MKTIFISYAREDRDHAEDLARALTARGYNVWWDWNLVAGENFRQVIRDQLSSADKAIVIWSENSNSSSFVIDEVSTARNLNKLIPTSIDGAAPPFGFGDLHTLPLSNSAADIELIEAAIENKVAELVPRPWYRKLGSRHALGTLSVLSVGLAGLALVPQYSSRQSFAAPVFSNGMRVDNCLHWGRECGEPAATSWCRWKGFKRSFDHEFESGIPPTFILGDEVVCDKPFCTGFRSVVCEK